MTKRQGETKKLKRIFLLFSFIFCFLLPAVPAGAEKAEMHVYDVTDYKAYPDNGRDDTWEFQKVLDLAKGNKEGITVLVPKGEYNISGTLDVYSNTHILMEDGARIVTTGGDVFRGAHTDEWGNACSNRNAGCIHGMYSQTQNVILEGGEITSSNRDDMTSNGYIVFSHGKNITVRNMTIDGNCSHAIRFYGCRDVSVKGCTIINNYATHARWDAGAFESVQLGDNCIDASEGYPYPHDDSKTLNASIIGCLFENVITGIGNHANCPMADGVLISDCVFKNVGGDHGLGPSSGAGYGIDLSTISHSVIRDNTFFMNSSSFAGILGTLWDTGTSIGHLIEGNLIFTRGRFSIFLDEGATAMIRNNILVNRYARDGYQSSQIKVSDSAHAKIDNGLISSVLYFLSHRA